MTSWLLFFALLAEPIIIDCRLDYPTYCSSSLEPGEGAPFLGVLVSPPLAAHLYLTEKNEQRRIDAAVKRAVELQNVKLIHEKELRQIEREQAAQKLVTTQSAQAAQLDAVRPSWYEHPAFLIPVTVAATLGAVLLAVEALDDRKDES